MKTRQLFISLILGLGLALALLWLLGRGQPFSTFRANVAQAQSGTGVIRVATTGIDTPGCGGGDTPCRTVQYAVDQAQANDEILVAAGTYTGVSARTGVTQVVYISKSVTIRGGYTTAFTNPPDPEANPTTLDAQGQGRVLYITGDISPTIEGLGITGGDGGGSAGGGVYVSNATATINNNLVFGNTADRGGGLYLGQGDGTLSHNVVSFNTANYGGGLNLYHSAATLNDNTVTTNTAEWYGGGLYLRDSAATLSGNIVASNTTARGGGGLCLWDSNSTLSGNTVTANTAHYGGGLNLFSSDATLSGNIVASNTPTSGEGGLYLLGSFATLGGNTVIANTAEYGGGLYLDESDALLANNVIADNRANSTGRGLHVVASSPRLLHTTLARNTGGYGSGLYITGRQWSMPYPWYHCSTLALTNTILVSHTVGITITAGNTATLEATLWGTSAWANTTNWDGAGTVITGTHNYWGDPAFAGPDDGDYHIGADSAAIDVGVDAGGTTDIDSQFRPQGDGYDIGADEFGSNKGFLPIIMKGYCGPDTYEPNAPCGEAEALTLPASISSYISCYDVAFGKDGSHNIGCGYDYFSIIVGTGGTVNIVLSDVPAGQDYGLYLYQGNCSTLIEGGQDVDTISEDLGPGTYYILVYSGISGQHSTSPHSLQVTSP